MYPISKPPDNAPKAVPRGEKMVSNTAPPRGKEGKAFVTNPDLEELDRKLPNSPVSIRIRIPTNPTIAPAIPIVTDDIANKIPPKRIVLIILGEESIRIPYKETGRKITENIEEYASISA